MDTLVEPKLMLEKDLQCYHCGESCNDHDHVAGDKYFCCQGCQLVYELLAENKLEHFYDQWERSGLSQKNLDKDRYAGLEQPALADQLIDFREGNTARITLSLPQIHCSACIWLLEKLYRFHPGIQASKVNFMRREAYITFDISRIGLRELAELLAGIGYPPDFNLSNLDRKQTRKKDYKLLYQLGVAGFAFGNSMLLSFPEYLGLDHSSESWFRSLFGYLNLGLALPVVLYSAQDYWRAARVNLASRTLTIDIPIALGIFTLFARSAWEIFSQSGAGYLDSLTGLVFFLLIGKWFQQKTYHRLSFERDYQAYFPIAVRMPDGAAKGVKDLEIGDVMLIRNGELLPADGILLSGRAQIDYSFVTGEALPVTKEVGDQLYAGGRQNGEELEVKINRPISQSYLTRLWDQEAFSKDKERQHVLTTDRMGKRFTITILTVATLSFLYWLPRDTGVAVNVFTAVLIIACPCALALSVPFTLGSAMRLLGRAGLFLKNTNVIERIKDIQVVVFDKTGTLTQSGENLGVQYEGRRLTGEEKAGLHGLCRQSGHPLARAIAAWAATDAPAAPIGAFAEITGKGMSGKSKQHQFQLGSATFLGVEPLSGPAQQVFLRIDGELVGGFTIKNRYRDSFATLIGQLGSRYELHLLSGDNDRESAFLQPYFPDGHLHFQQSPQDKLDFIRELQSQGKKVMMIGDGLNDAGALQQSEVGMVIAEDTNNFTPACDAILEAGRFARISDYLRYAVSGNRMVVYAYLLALVYNVIGLSFAVQGLLTPVVAAILMPLSSVTIVTFGVLSTQWSAYRKRLI